MTTAVAEPALDTELFFYDRDGDRAGPSKRI